MITLFKQRGSRTTASHIFIDELVQQIHEGKYRRELGTYRESWLLQEVSRMDDDIFGLELCVEEHCSVGYGAMSYRYIEHNSVGTGALLRKV